MPVKCAARWRSTQRGLSLVESLVALLVLSIGLLGIAGLFVESVRSSRSALLRTQAVNLVSDMGDRIRANAVAGDAYDSGNYQGGPGIRGCAPDLDDEGRGCSPAELAEDDLARWSQAVRDALPTLGDAAPEAIVEYVAPLRSGEPERYAVSVSWREPGDDLPLTYRAEVMIMPRRPVS
jgi:type IV pilus assembly protein PilV